MYAPSKDSTTAINMLHPNMYNRNNVLQNVRHFGQLRTFIKILPIATESPKCTAIVALTIVSNTINTKRYIFALY